MAQAPVAVPAPTPQKFEVDITPAVVSKIVVVVGSTGTGKTTLINMLFNNDSSAESCIKPYDTANTAAACTKKPIWLFNLKDYRIFGDTIGFGDPTMKQEEIANSIREFIQKFMVGFHALIIVAKYGRISDSERANLLAILELFEQNKNTLLVLTNYTGKKDAAGRKDAIEKWIADDQMVRNFVTKINNNVIVSNNCVDDLLEEVTRPLRKQCLDELNAFINNSNTLIRTNLSLKEIVDRLGIAYKTICSIHGSTYATALGITLTNLACQDVSCGECAICLEPMDMQGMHLTPCQHCFHATCIKEAFEKNAKCPICRTDFNEVYRIVLYKNDIL